MKKTIVAVFGIVLLSSFSKGISNKKEGGNNIETSLNTSFVLMNDTNQKISINTTKGVVYLFDGCTTSIECNIGEDIRWGKANEKDGVIFKITTNMCGEVLKFSDLVNYF